MKQTKYVQIVTLLVTLPLLFQIIKEPVDLLQIYAINVRVIYIKILHLKIKVIFLV